MKYNKDRNILIIEIIHINYKIHYIWCNICHILYGTYVLISGLIVVKLVKLTILTINIDWLWRI